MSSDIHQRPFSQEFKFKASRSSGAGGQHVNKVSSRVELRFHVQSSAFLSEEEKKIILLRAANRINKEGYLQLFCQASRSQLDNKHTVVEAFYAMLAICLVRKKVRKPTRTTVSGRMKRLDSKKIQGQKKKERRTGFAE